MARYRAELTQEGLDFCVSGEPASWNTVRDKMVDVCVAPTAVSVMNRYVFPVIWMYRTAQMFVFTDVDINVEIHMLKLFEKANFEPFSLRIFYRYILGTC